MLATKTGTVLAALVAVDGLVLALCLFWPTEVGNLVVQLVNDWPALLAVFKASLLGNFQLLNEHAGQTHALSFLALQAALLVTVAGFTPVLVASVYLDTLDRADGGTLPGLAAIFMLGLGLFQWTFLGGDFFLVTDGDFTGVLRPGTGTLIFAALAWVIPFLLALPLARLLKEVRRRR